MSARLGPDGVPTVAYAVHCQGDVHAAELEGAGRVPTATIYSAQTRSCWKWAEGGNPIASETILGHACSSSGLAGGAGLWWLDERGVNTVNQTQHLGALASGIMS